MAMSLNNLKPAKGAKNSSKRVGRGNASGKGTTAGRGTKGQKARTGGRGGHKIRGMRRLVLSTPKLRGFKRQSARIDNVNLNSLQDSYQDGAIVTIKSLKSKGLVPSNSKFVKILGFGTLKKGLKIKGCQVSTSAKDKILAAGGEVR